MIIIPNLKLFFSLILKINTENFIKEEELFNYVKKKINIIQRINFKVKDDDWFLYLLK